MGDNNFSLTIDREKDVNMGELINKSGGVWQGSFSFKENSPNRIYPFSSSLDYFIANDSGEKAIGKNNYGKFLNSMPMIQFRAYYPNTALNEIFSLMGKMGFNIEDFKGMLSWENLEKFFGEAGYILKGLARPNSSKNIASHVVSKVKGSLPEGDDAIIKLPYALYYRLVSTINNAVYEIPCNVPSGYFDSNGSYGWSGGDEVDILNASGFFKKIANVFHFTMMPFFTPGNGGEGESFNIKLDLMNDTAQAAECNYKFVQTLILNNKWLQYGITQLPGSVYDVKLPSGQRFFMCTGDFKVSYKGVLRSIGKMATGFKPYGKETKIPDAYSLDLTFKSLLPNNLNNYLFGIAQNENKDLMDPKHKEESVFSEIAGSLADALKSVGIGEKTSSSEFAKETKNIISTDEDGKKTWKKIDNEANEKAQEAARKVLENGGIAEEAEKAAQEAYENSIREQIANDDKASEKIEEYVKGESEKLENLTKLTNELEIPEEFTGKTAKETINELRQRDDEVSNLMADELEKPFIDLQTTQDKLSYYKGFGEERIKVLNARNESLALRETKINDAMHQSIVKNGQRPSYELTSELDDVIGQQGQNVSEINRIQQLF